MSTYQTPSEIKEIYTKKNIVSEYDALRFEAPLPRMVHQAEVEEVNKYCQNKGLVDSVLELAVGTGRVSKNVKNIRRGVAFDNSEEMLRYSGQILDPSVWKMMKGDAFNLPFESNFDLVYSFRFIRHFNVGERQLLYKQILKSLKPKGAFIFEALNLRAPVSVKERFGIGKANIVDKPIYDELWERESLLKELDSAGFTNTVLVPVYRSSVVRYLDRIFSLTKFNHLAKKNKILGSIIVTLYSNIETVSSDKGNCFEWVVICQKSG
ncbi:hypothetical protein COY32_03685 [candidate division WWE3 bacterium CG_4_10_14_0_2_um_filter_41_14]|uniref:Methyltransferase domain-containing protein n=1 Tax=candidate division WWE3 bacterium CG_4_10_14_0_2_um_filter_41_14 TaxID=1975072 RepID=A0A2M7TIN0_UNCKA|nr:MAG: hypothetical protein COY32_03685 [candidate division WWE3 bacterium CG_4_10_14_0_2_um_filter_41_14]